MPTAFFVTTGKPNQTDEAGRIEESYYVVQVFLSDASGMPSGEGHTIVRDELFTARQALRQRLGPGPDHRPIQYRDVGWR